MKKAALNLMSLLITVIIAGVFNTCLIAQSVPMGINYQAVARDANGDELINRNIDVRLSIISGSPDGEVEWEEVHSEVTTSQFGLFNIVIGQGIYSNGTVTSFEDIPWGDNLHFLKVEIKFDSEYLTMGTMQFLSVPYALYAKKSLEPGPQGLQGPAGDPATDDQVLSYDPQNHVLSLENIPLVGFRAEKLSGETVPTSTDTTLIFESEISDYGNGYNEGTGTTCGLGSFTGFRIH